MKISVLIPTYNEEKTIQKTLDEVLKERLVGEVIIVDDGSKDGTRNILNRVKKTDPRLVIVYHELNQGKGAAIRTALSKATQEYVLIQDADLEYDPKDYSVLSEKVSPSTVVFGSRLLAKNVYAYTRTYLGNVVITHLCNLLFGTNLTDSYTCYKLMSTKIARSLNLTADGFELEAEITGKLAKRKILIVEVPISFKPRKYEEGKKIKALDAIKGALMFLKIKFS